MIGWQIGKFRIDPKYVEYEKAAKVKALRRSGAYAMKTVRNLLSRRPPKDRVIAVGVRDEYGREVFIDNRGVPRATDDKGRGKSSGGQFVSPEVAKKALLAAKRIRRKRQSSKPGDPPFRHGGQLRDRIVFDVDKHGTQCEIGPLVFKGSNVPEVLEFGGTTKARLPTGRQITVKIEPRPYLTPKLPLIEEKFLQFIAEGDL
jgi:hypothetical protein